VGIAGGGRPRGWVVRRASFQTDDVGCRIKGLVLQEREVLVAGHMSYQR